MKQILQRFGLMALALCAPFAAQAQVSLTGGTYSQNFDTLANTAGSTTNSSLPAGWLIAETGGGARDNELYAVDAGGSNTGDTYSYGAAANSERALGGLRSGTLIPVFGACFSNGTGGALSGFDVAYTGEQWRLGTISRTDRLDFQYSLDATSLTTGTWIDVNTLDFTTPNTTGTVGTRDGNAAANRTAVSATVGSISIPSGDTFCVRWNDLDATSSDDGLAVDDFAISVAGSLGPTLSINDVDVTEGNAGTTSATFTVSLSAPAGAGGVTFDIATADNTATVANNDYVASAPGSQTIPAGSSSYAFTVLVNGDTANEVNESYYVNVTNITGANAGDVQAVGAIVNDDFNVTPIHQIQGNGLLSPVNGQVVITEGIVTALKFNNGFFLQTADDEVDADPATSQGIFVFTGSAPPPSAARGNRVRVTGTVTEFTPGSDLNQLPITQIVSPTVVQLGTGNPLPAPAMLTATEANASATPGTLERYEGMRVSVQEATVVEGSGGNINESSATSTTTGVFQVVVSGVARPFREPGIGVMDVMPIPAGKTPPFFDTNQERLMVRSRGQVGASPLAVDVGTTITGLLGVLDYFGGTWAILPDAGVPPVASGGMTPIAIADQGIDEVTIGGFNLLRFFDEVNDANGAPTLTAAALDKRLTKTSLAICDYVKAPDILGVVEVENLRVLGLLADRINASCARAPAYVPYLVQGNDPGGINVGFLVSSRAAGPTVATPRVEVLEVVQHGKTTPFTNPDNSTSLLNDRPPLMLRAIVRAANGAAYPVTVFTNHLRSLNGVDDTSPGSSGWPTEGDRVRNKRAQQAAFLATLVDNRQQANPAEKIVLVGDFNAFEFNDGYTDVMGIIRGDQVPANEVITWLASPVATPLVDGSELIADAAARYSYVFEGSAQTLDHVVLNEALMLDPAVRSVRIEHPRINADFGVHHFGVAGSPVRVSDHDPVRLAIRLPAFSDADLSVTAGVDAAQVPTGGAAVFRTEVGNAGPEAAAAPVLTVTFNALVAPIAGTPAGWTCEPPVQDTVGETTTLRCSTITLSSGTGAAFSFTIPVDAALGDRILRMDATIRADSRDPQPGNDSASAQLVAGRNADLAVGWTSQIAHPTMNVNQLLVRNLGSSSTTARVSIQVDAPAGSVSKFEVPAGWQCARPSPNALDCTKPTLGAGDSAAFKAHNVRPRLLPVGQSVRMSATVSGALPDPQPANNVSVIP